MLQLNFSTKFLCKNNLSGQKRTFAKDEKFVKFTFPTNMPEHKEEGKTRHIGT